MNELKAILDLLFSKEGAPYVGLLAVVLICKWLIQSQRHRDETLGKALDKCADAVSFSTGVVREIKASVDRMVDR